MLDVEKKPYLSLKKQLTVIQDSAISDLIYNDMEIPRQNWFKLMDKNVVDVSQDKYGIVIVVEDYK